MSAYHVHPVGMSVVMYATWESVRLPAKECVHTMQGNGVGICPLWK